MVYERIGGYRVMQIQTLPGHAQARGFWPRKYIAVGTEFGKLPEYEQIAILHHEACHCRRWHLERRVLALVLALVPLAFLPLAVLLPALAAFTLWHLAAWSARVQELEADSYATDAGHGPGMVSYLLRNHANMGSDFYPSNAERINRIVKVELEKSPC